MPKRYNNNIGNIGNFEDFVPSDDSNVIDIINQTKYYDETPEEKAARIMQKANVFDESKVFIAGHEYDRDDLFANQNDEPENKKVEESNEKFPIKHQDITYFVSYKDVDKMDEEGNVLCFSDGEAKVVNRKDVRIYTREELANILNNQKKQLKNDKINIENNQQLENKKFSIILNNGKVYQMSFEDLKRMEIDKSVLFFKDGKVKVVEEGNVLIYTPGELDVNMYTQENIKAKEYPKEFSVKIKSNEILLVDKTGYEKSISFEGTEYGYRAIKFKDPKKEVMGITEKHKSFFLRNTGDKIIDKSYKKLCKNMPLSIYYVLREIDKANDSQLRRDFALMCLRENPREKGESRKAYRKRVLSEIMDDLKNNFGILDITYDISEKNNLTKKIKDDALKARKYLYATIEGGGFFIPKIDPLVKEVKEEQALLLEETNEVISPIDAAIKNIIKQEMKEQEEPLLSEETKAAMIDKLRKVSLGKNIQEPNKEGTESETQPIDENINQEESYNMDEFQKELSNSVNKIMEQEQEQKQNEYLQAVISGETQEETNKKRKLKLFTGNVASLVKTFGKKTFNGIKNGVIGAKDTIAIAASIKYGEHGSKHADKLEKDDIKNRKKELRYKKLHAIGEQSKKIKELVLKNSKKYVSKTGNFIKEQFNNVKDYMDVSASIKEGFNETKKAERKEKRKQILNNLKANIRYYTGIGLKAKDKEQSEKINKLKAESKIGTLKAKIFEASKGNRKKIAGVLGTFVLIVGGAVLGIGLANNYVKSEQALQGNTPKIESNIMLGNIDINKAPTINQDKQEDKTQIDTPDFEQVDVEQGKFEEIEVQAPEMLDFKNAMIDALDLGIDSEFVKPDGRVTERADGGREGNLKNTGKENFKVGRIAVVNDDGITVFRDKEKIKDIEENYPGNKVILAVEDDENEEYVGWTSVDEVKEALIDSAIYKLKDQLDEETMSAVIKAKETGVIDKKIVDKIEKIKDKQTQQTQQCQINMDDDLEL